MKGIPEIAYGHHEKLDGSGYPRGLTAERIPLQARMMTISDIFDALTAQDRPYKRAVAPTTALDILHDEARQGKLDSDLLDVFVTQTISLPARCGSRSGASGERHRRRARDPGATA